MKTLIYYCSLLTLLLFCSQCNSNSNSETINNLPPASSPKTEITKTSSILGELNIEASVNHKNLQLFMIKGTTEADNLIYTPLQKAMEKKWVEIIETSNVNELAISNHSDKTIFIHAGDIVKGGKQDRTLAYDMIIAPQAKNEKLYSFCVESDRWHQRGEESVVGFTSNDYMLTSRDLKIASKEANNQSHVWSEVAEQQEKLNYNISHHYSTTVDVKDETSASSLELTLENEELKELKELYKAKFKQLDISNATGVACAINGELYYIDNYNNRQLFLDLWDKLLDAAIVEAISDLDTKEKTPTYLSLDELEQALIIAAKAKQETKMLNKRTEWLSKEDDTKILFTSLDRGNASKWIHKNLIVRDVNAIQPASQIQNRNYLNLNIEEIQNVIED